MMDLTRRFPLMFTALLALLPASGYGRSPLTDSLDARISNDEEAENSVFVSPLNPNVVLVSSNALGATSGWISVDGGDSWTSNTTTFGSGDPAAAISKAITPDGRFVVNPNYGDAGQAVFYKDSTSPTVAWVGPVEVVGGDPATDKGHLWVDNTSTLFSPPRLYCGWTTVQDIRISYNDKNGEPGTPVDPGWKSPRTIPHINPGGAIEERWSVNIHTASTGHAYAVWANNTDASRNQAKSLGFSVSTDGGRIWSEEDFIVNVMGFDLTIGLTGTKSMPVTTYPSMAVDQNTGDIYVVWAAPESGPPAPSDIYFVKGTPTAIPTEFTWSAPNTVNQDSQGDQWHPWITWDECTGMLAVVFHDSRTDNNRAETWVAVSSNGGDDWQEIKVSDTSGSGDWESSTGIEYIGIAAGDGRVFPVWSDDRDLYLDYRPYVSPLLLWGIEQETISHVVVDNLDGTFTFGVGWQTNIAGGEELHATLNSPSQQVYECDASTYCGSASDPTETFHVISMRLPCEVGWWKYTVSNRREGCSFKRESDEKMFQVRYCLVP